MVKLLRTVLDVGLEKPVKILHITDVHITESNEEDDQRMKDLIEMRRQMFVELGNHAPLRPQEYLEEAFALAKEEGAFPVLTGDVQDLNSAGNRAEMHRVLDRIVQDGQDFLYTAGNHEFQRSSCTYRCGPLEEPAGYYVETRKALMEEFAFLGDWDFDNRIISGVNVITVDNSQAFFTKVTFERLKEEAKKGLPMVLFMHVPLTCKELTQGTYPESCLTEEEFAISMEALEYIRTNPLIKATFAGHLHREGEETLENGQKLYVTPGTFAGICRMIEIR